MSTAKGDWAVEASVSRARKLALEGRVEEAYDILVGVTGHNNNRTTFSNLRAQWRTELLKTLRMRFPDLTIYPQRNPGVDVKKLNLKSREMYVFELFDGGTSLEDAVALSPVDELDTLRSVARLLDQGALRLTARV